MWVRGAVWLVLSMAAAVGVCSAPADAASVCPSAPEPVIPLQDLPPRTVGFPESFADEHPRIHGVLRHGVSGWVSGAIASPALVPVEFSLSAAPQFLPPPEPRRLPEGIAVYDMVIGESAAAELRSNTIGVPPAIVSGSVGLLLIIANAARRHFARR